MLKKCLYNQQLSWSRDIPESFGLCEELHQAIHIFRGQLFCWRYIAKHHAQPSSERRCDSVIQLRNNTCHKVTRTDWQLQRLTGSYMISMTRVEAPELNLFLLAQREI
jgi:hypothetical protein